MGEDVQITDDPVLALAFAFVSERMRHNMQKYEEIVEKRREAGRKGGLQRVANLQANQANEANAKQTKQIKQVQDDSDSVSDSVSDSDINNIDNINIKTDVSINDNKKKELTNHDILEE
jgi:hypothetical protein